MSTPPIARLEDDDDAEAFARILSLCFGPTPEEARGWIERGGRENVRLLRQGGAVLGGLLRVPYRQWWGRQAVDMVGIGAVGMDPARRGAGGATQLMRAVVQELGEEGVALSTLFPATQPLYRRAGYEQGGGHWAIGMRTERIATEERTLGLRRAGPADEAAIERLHAEHGRESPGNVWRSALTWRRVRDPRPGPVHAFVVEGERGIEGYVYFVSRANAAHRQDLHLHDVVARTPEAARRLLAFFRDHRSTVDAVWWRGSPADPLLLQAREQRHEVQLKDVWMLRLVDVERALTRRGYPAGVQAEVHLDLQDDLLPRNAGRWVLRVEGGSGLAERGGHGSVRLDVRTFAPLYTGFASAFQLRAARGLACDDDDAAALTALFAGPVPWMQDGF